MFNWRRHIKKYQLSDYYRASRLLAAGDRKRLALISLVQVFSATLDIIGIMLIGLVGTMTVSALKSENQSNLAKNAIELLRIEKLDPAQQAMFLVSLAVVTLVTRTLFSAYFTKKILHYFSHQSARISINLYSKILASTDSEIRSRPIQETLFSVTKGVEFISIQVFASSMVILSDLSLLVFIFIGVLIVDPITAMVTILSIGLLIVILMYRLHKKVGKLGSKNTEINLIINSGIVESLQNFRENFVANRFNFYREVITSNKNKLASITGDLNFLPYTGKYVIEIAILLGATLIGGFQFFTHDSSKAISIFVIFLASGTRIAPAIMRIQQSLIQIKGGLSMAGPTLLLIDTYFQKIENEFDYRRSNFDDSHLGFVPLITVNDVAFKYSANSNFKLAKSKEEIRAGDFIGVVGQSGAGKSTFVDLMLGILTPDSGSITISGLSPKEAIARWPGAIAYVPQEVMIINGTIRENIILGYKTDEVPEREIWDALEKTYLTSFVRSLPGQLDEIINESGSNLSGGQRQRLGLARAFITKPKILVLDEATSSLDAETENFIADILELYKDERIVLSIAHRLSSIRNADRILFFDGGRLESTGTFEELKKNSAKFANQARLMGL